MGGSTGGVAAAWASSSLGLEVFLLEETSWLGGQLTTQGVCTPDEQAHIEYFGATSRYSSFRNKIREYYCKNFQLSEEAQTKIHFNPGNCWVSKLSYEPKVGEKVLRELLEESLDSGHLKIFFQHRAIECEMEGDRVSAVVAENSDGAKIRMVASIVLDATDLGELLPMCGVEGEDWSTGAESFAETGEPDAPEFAKPHWVQPFTFPFASL